MVKKFEYFNFIIKFINKDKDNLILNTSDNQFHLNNFMYNFGNSILNSEEIIILLSLFVLFIGIFLLFSFNIVKKIFNFLIFLSTCGITVLLLAYLINVDNFMLLENEQNKNKIEQESLNNKFVPILGNDYTYVKRIIFL